MEPQPYHKFFESELLIQKILIPLQPLIILVCLELIQMGIPAGAPPAGSTHGGSPQSGAQCRYECLLIDLNAISLFSSSLREYEPTLTDLFNNSILLHSYCPASQTELRERILRLLHLFRQPEHE